jgi:hypothetical protein
MTADDLTAIREAAKSTLDDNSDTCLAARKNAMNVLALLDEVARVMQERDVTHEYMCSKMKDHIAVLNDALNVTRAENERLREVLREVLREMTDKSTGARFCVECGWQDTLDEDGSCPSCGRTAYGSAVSHLHAVLCAALATGAPAVQAPDLGTFEPLPPEKLDALIKKGERDARELDAAIKGQFGLPGTLDAPAPKPAETPGEQRCSFCDRLGGHEVGLMICAKDKPGMCICNKCLSVALDGIARAMGEPVPREPAPEPKEKQP